MFTPSVSQIDENYRPVMARLVLFFRASVTGIIAPQPVTRRPQFEHSPLWRIAGVLRRLQTLES